MRSDTGLAPAGGRNSPRRRRYEWIVQVNEAEPLPPLASVAVTVTEEVPSLVGVPEMRPEELIDRPRGSPLARQVTVKPPESVADNCRATEV